MCCYDEPSLSSQTISHPPEKCREVWLDRLAWPIQDLWRLFWHLAGVVRCGQQPSIPLSHQACTVKVPLFCYVHVRCIFTVTLGIKGIQTSETSYPSLLILFSSLVPRPFPSPSFDRLQYATSMFQLRYLWCISLVLASTLQFHLLCLVGKFWCLPNPEQPTNCRQNVSSKSVQNNVCVCLKHIHSLHYKQTYLKLGCIWNYTVEAVSTTMHTREHAFLCGLW